MKDIKARKGAFLLARLIAEGEHDTQDFKHSVSDAAKIARSIAAFANHKGGRLLIGVKDNGVITGVRNEEDLYVVESAAQLYCRPSQQVNFTAYRAEGGETVMVATVEEAGVRPVEARDTDGSWQAYIRVADENIAAPNIMTEAWRRNAQGEGANFVFSAGESAMLKALTERDLTIEETMKAAHMSERACKDAASRLYAMEVIGLKYSGGKWRLTVTDEEEPS